MNSSPRLEAFFTREWQRNSPWQILLRPISWLFGLVAGLRRAMFRAGLLKIQHLKVPVVVVGNICVGGTGKTPLVMAVVHWLQEHGYRPGIVSRGYGSLAEKTGQSHEVATSDDAAAAKFGDEPVMLVLRLGCPMFVGADRARAATSLLAAHPEVNVIVSDDGLQHYAMHRDVEIALVDGSRGFGNGALLPAGPLREPVRRLFRVSAVVANGTGRRFKQAMPSLLGMTLGNERFVPMAGGEELDLETFRAFVEGKSLHLLAGTGNPQRFFSHLHRHGFVTSDHPLDDHHRFRREDIEYPGIVLMTEKDAVKCRQWADQRHWFMRVDAQLPVNFYTLLHARLADWKIAAGRRAEGKS